MTIPHHNPRLLGIDEDLEKISLAPHERLSSSKSRRSLKPRLGRFGKV